MAQHVLLIAISGSEQRVQFKAALERSRHHLVFALDGDEAYQRFDEVKPDLVIVHKETKRLGGEVLCRMIRRAAGGSEVPLVLFGSSDAPDLSLVDAWLPEPFERRQLQDVIAPLLAYGRPEKDQGEALPVEVGERPSGDGPTVVGFKNPFFESAEGSAALEDGAPTVAVDDADAAVTPTSERAPGLVLLTLEPDAADPTPVPDTEAAHDTNPAMVQDPALSQDRVPELNAIEPAVSDNEAHDEAEGEAHDEGEDQAEDEGRRALDESQLGQRLTQRVRALHAGLNQVDYYQLLGVERTADEARIHAAWFELSLEIHPDRFFLLRSGELKEMLFDIYHRATEAHDVLGDPERRLEYDRSRSLSPPSSRPDTPHSEERVDLLELDAESSTARIFAKRAEAAFARGAIQEARFQLYALLACEGSNASARRALERVEEEVGPSV